MTGEESYINLQREIEVLTMSYDSLSIFNKVPDLVNMMIKDGEQSAKEPRSHQKSKHILRRHSRDRE
jgi:hypothetical protein